MVNSGQCSVSFSTLQSNSFKTSNPVAVPSVIVISKKFFYHVHMNTYFKVQFYITTSTVIAARFNYNAAVLFAYLEFRTSHTPNPTVTIPLMFLPNYLLAEVPVYKWQKTYEIIMTLSLMCRAHVHIEKLTWNYRIQSYTLSPKVLCPGKITHSYNNCLEAANLLDN